MKYEEMRLRAAFKRGDKEQVFATLSFIASGEEMLRDSWFAVGAVFYYLDGRDAVVLEKYTYERPVIHGTKKLKCLEKDFPEDYENLMNKTRAAFRPDMSTRDHERRFATEFIAKLEAYEAIVVGTIHTIFFCHDVLQHYQHSATAQQYLDMNTMEMILLALGYPSRRWWDTPKLFPFMNALAKADAHASMSEDFEDKVRSDEAEAGGGEEEKDN